MTAQQAVSLSDPVPLLADALLSEAGMPAELVPGGSQARFADGADFRIEIPSVEGPEVLRAVLDEADSRGVTVNRVSQGSGAMTLTLAEQKEMANIGADRAVEVCLFTGPREEWGIAAMSRADDGGFLHGSVRGMRQLRYAVEDVHRSIDCGIRSFLIADLGLLDLLVRAQRSGHIPADVVWKGSVLCAPSNPASLALLERLGAATVNLPTDMSIHELAEMRSVTRAPLDLYVEAPDSMGGVVRGEQLADLITIARPLYAKFGLRNSAGLYPSGLHLVDQATVIAREKVRRASVALEWVDRCGGGFRQTVGRAADLGIPVR
ncbi:U32 family peptidase [Mycolicibacterium nivoides]|uniref:U32 family peptidase n=1 Tax=Mycolicibacterium nivoides TaxID=2487344 RepID=UPI0008AEB23F|nr:U32 family peptidase [Mycolicibacterium nivoides]MBN3512016.1 U32 family peptidase [Mycolicibacterium septicum]QRY47389.1 U32 family peptidase [Mycolicibacterium boenickei]SEP61127.1 Peptidase family U32 [Mycobacterium sp. 88mf]SFF05774.1 Peptidase family U32 [Mycobacterium sp. 455mf]